MKTTDPITTNNPPLISIVVPVYRGEKFLPITLRSIQEQTLRNWECVVVDDGSPDGTLAVARQIAEADARIRVLTQENAGPAMARNHGYAVTNPNSQYVTFMDGDDVWMPDTLETLVGELEKDPSKIGAHGLAEYIDEHGEMLHPGLFSGWGRSRLGFDENAKIRQRDESEPTTFPMFLLNNTVFPPGIVLTKRLYYEKAGLFDRKIVLVEDWDMIIRLSRQGDYRFVNKIVAHYRRHGGNISAHCDERMKQAIRVLHHKTFFSPENTKEQKKLLRKCWRTLQIINLKDKLKTMRNNFATGSFAVATKTLMGINVQFLRYLRGYPTLHGL